MSLSQVLCVAAIWALALTSCHAPFHSNSAISATADAASTSLSGFAPEEASESSVAWPAEIPAVSSTGACAPGIELGCTTALGTGTATCGSDGTELGRCALLSCAPGLTLAGSICVPGACESGDVAPCASPRGTGTMTCGDSLVWGSCVMSACASGYHLSSGRCESDSCEAGEIRTCARDNGFGAQACDGESWGRCVTTGCAAGFHLQLGRCVNNPCTPGGVTACQDASGIGSGEQACNAIGSGFSACVLSSCAAGYRLAGGVCVASATCETGQMRACPLPNGAGSQTCSSGEWGACAPTTCHAGFIASSPSGGQCVPLNCKPGQSMACQASGGVGSGTMSCNAQGTGFDGCVLTACRPGYTLAAGLCVTVGEAPVPSLGAGSRVADAAPVAPSVATSEPNIICRMSTLGQTRPCVAPNGDSGLQMCSLMRGYEWSACATGR